MYIFKFTQQFQEQILIKTRMSKFVNILNKITLPDVKKINFLIPLLQLL